MLVWNPLSAWRSALQMITHDEERSMSNHKRKRAKNARAGCLMCKPNKMNGWPKGKLGHVGFGKLRAEQGARDAVREAA